MIFESRWIAVPETGIWGYRLHQFMTPLGSRSEPRPAPASSTTAADRRRIIRTVLGEAAGPLSLADLAVEIVERERGAPAGETDWDAVQRCRLEIYHAHVPKLADDGLVAYDPDRRVVTGVE